MAAVSRSHILTAAVLAATAEMAALALTSRPSHPPQVSAAIRLVDAAGDSVLNIPVNLFDDFANIPANEVQGLDTAASSLMFNTNIFVVGSANLFGIDPGDPTHVAAIDSLFAPFPTLTEGAGGLNYEITGLLAAELPTSLSCAVTTCYPIVPPDVVTGVTGIDRDLGFAHALVSPDFGLFRNWFTAPLTGPDSLSTGYYFNPAAGGSTDSGPAYSGLGFSNQPDGNYFLGGTVDPVTGAPSYNPTTGVFDPNATQVPWAGHTFTLNVFQPFENFYNSLLAPPSTSGLFGTGIESVTPTELFQGLQADAAGLVVTFNPFEPGSPLCPGSCELLGSTGPLGITLPIVQDINSLTPGGNPIIDEFLTAVAGGYSNIPTQSDIAYTHALLDTGAFTFTPQAEDSIISTLSAANPALPNLVINAGLLTDPGYLPVSPGVLATDPTAEYGGLNPTLILPDLVQLFGGSAAASNSALSADVAGLLGANLAPDVTSIATSLF